MDLRRILLYAAERNPGLPATVEAAASYTYDEWVQRVLALADGLAARGVRHGDRVAIGMRNSIDHATAFFATQAMGAVAVPFNFRLKADDIAQVLADAGARAVLADDSVPLDDVRRAYGVPEDTLWIGTGANRPSFAVDLGDLMAGGSPRLHNTVRPEDLSAILYTSGTTGRPKGVPIIHRNAWARLVSYVTSVGPLLESGMKTLGAAPIYHTVGLHWVLCLTVFLNGTYYPVPEVNRDHILGLIRDQELTFLFGSPTLFHILLTPPPGQEGEQEVRLESVTDVSFGSAPMPPSLLEKIRRSFPRATVNEVYGTTELSIPFVTRDVSRYPTGALRITADHRVRVVRPGGSPDDVVAPGEVGELLVDMNNEACFSGYWNAPEKTAERVRDGWFYTGDAFHRDEHGNYYIGGRLDDMIITGAENVQPAEVERVLSDHPGVDDVAVIGIPDPRWGQVVTAFVVRRDPKLTEKDIDRHCRNSTLADFKRPRKIIFLDRIPRNPSGKILRRSLRELHEATAARAAELSAAGSERSR